MWRYCERRGAEVGGRIAASAGFAVLHRRARSSTGQSIGLRIRPSPVTQRDIASSEETENPCARRVFCALSKPADSLRVSRNRLDSGRNCPTYAQLFWARQGRVFFKSPMLSGNRKSWAQVRHGSEATPRVSALRDCRLLTRAATLPGPTITSRVGADRQWLGIPVQPKATRSSFRS